MSTPHQLALCVLLRNFCYEPEDSNLPPGGRIPLFCFILEQIKESGELQEKSLQELAAQLLLVDEIGSQFVQVVTSELDLLSSVDQLNSYSSTLRELLRPPGDTPLGLDGGSLNDWEPLLLEPSSPLGLLLRRLLLAFEQLPFEGVARLTAHLQEYVAAAAADEDVVDMSTGHLRPVENLRDSQLIPIASVDEAASRLTAELSSRLGRDDVAALTKVVTDLEAQSSQSQRVLYLKYALSLALHDATAAIDALHAAFDLNWGALPQQQLALPKSQPATAALELASAHLAFEHVEIALQTLTEAVRRGQVAGDANILACALGVLCRLLASTPSEWHDVPGTPTDSKDQPSGVAKTLALLRLITRCSQRAAELRLPVLMAYSALLSAQVRVYHGIACLDGTASEVDESLRFVRVLCSTVVAGDASAKGWEGTPGMQWSVPPPVPLLKQMVASGYVLLSAAWEQGGFWEQADLNARVVLECYTLTASADDLCLAYIRRATCAFHRKGPAAAAGVLETAWKLLPNLADDYRLRAAQLALAGAHAIARRNVPFANAVLGCLDRLVPLKQRHDVAAQVSVGIMHAQVLLLAGRNGEASDIAHDLIAKAQAAELQAERCKLLIVLAKVALAAKDSAQALPNALVASSLAKTLNLGVLMAESSVTLAEVWLEVGSAEFVHLARQRLVMDMPLVLERGGAELQARAHLASARAILAGLGPGAVRATSDAVPASLAASAACAAMADNVLLQAEALELTAVVWNERGNATKRDAAAAQWETCAAAVEAAQKVDESSGTSSSRGSESRALAALWGLSTTLAL